MPDIKDKIQLYKGDCLEIMKNIPDKSIDMILCDLPYGKTVSKWDSAISFEPLWKQYNRIIKDNGAIVLFAQQPFTTLLISSNMKEFRHNIVWHKDKCANFIQAKNQPRKTTEDIIVFSKEGSGFTHNSKNKCTYNPQMINRKPRGKEKGRERSKNIIEIKGKGCMFKQGEDFISDKSYPENIVYFKTEHKNRFHPTQKPVALLEYLIKTYTDEGETILDNCMGSGSTGIACLRTNRNFIGIEKDDKYFDVAYNRINEYIKMETQERNESKGYGDTRNNSSIRGVKENFRPINNTTSKLK